MTDREYRQDDTSDGYCPLCAEPLSNLTMAAQGYCKRHGWVSADWTPNGARPANTAGPEGNEWTPRTASGTALAEDDFDEGGFPATDDGEGDDTP